jgi:hypothetical protein
MKGSVHQDEMTNGKRALKHIERRPYERNDWGGSLETSFVLFLGMPSPVSNSKQMRQRSFVNCGGCPVPHQRDFAE